MTLRAESESVLSVTIGEPALNSPARRHDLAREGVRNYLSYRYDTRFRSRLGAHQFMASSPETTRTRGRPKVRRVRPSAPVRAITVDDVISDLLELFKQVGSDPSTIANRVRYIGSMPTWEVRPYDHSVAIGDLLTFWHQDPDFTDETGNPLPLKLKGRQRTCPSSQKILKCLRRQGTGKSLHAKHSSMVHQDTPS